MSSDESTPQKSKLNEFHRNAKLNGNSFKETLFNYQLDTTPTPYRHYYNWKLGDWAICEMKVVQITALDKETLLPTSVSDGTGTMSCNDWTSRLFPLTLENKSWGESFAGLRNRLRDYSGLNFAAISRYFNTKFEECLRSHPDNRVAIFQQVERFTRDVEKLVGDRNDIVVDGVKVFRD